MNRIFWLATRPFIRPFFLMRQRSQEEREAELEEYRRQEKAALQELKIELLLANRQVLRDRARGQTEGEQ